MREQNRERMASDEIGSNRGSERISRNGLHLNGCNQRNFAPNLYPVSHFHARITPWNKEQRRDLHATGRPRRIRGTGGKERATLGYGAIPCGGGVKEFKRGRYLLAIESFKKSQRHRDEPSYGLANWTGLAYQALGRYAEAIEHYSASIEIEDSSPGRVNRGIAYLFYGQCGPALTDGKAALAMGPESGTGIHTDAEANYILASCYAYDGRYLLALQHAEAGLSISIEQGYKREMISEREALVQQIRQAMHPSQGDIDFFIAAALEVSMQGVELFEEGDYWAAIRSFETARSHHGKPSTVIESWIGLSYHSLEQHNQAIAAFTKAIEIRDSAIDRLNRGLSYLLTGHCLHAIDDAEIALSMPAYEEAGYNSFTEANSLLASCYMEEGNYKLASVFAEAALSGAIANGYPVSDIEALMESRDFAKSLASTEN